MHYKNNKITINCSREFNCVNSSLSNILVVFFPAALVQIVRHISNLMEGDTIVFVKHKSIITSETVASIIMGSANEVSNVAFPILK